MFQRNISLSASKLFSFQSLKSSNALCQSWEATQLRRQEKCFVKVAAPEGSLSEEAATSILQQSFKLQRRICSARVVRARTRHEENGVLYIEYPWVNPDLWQELTPDVFWLSPRLILSQVCLLADYIHMLGLVHRDLNLANFLVNRQPDSGSVLLADLDFLAPEGCDSMACIVGTPYHIPPEIVRNERVLVQSDNYAVGVSLLRFLDELHPNQGTATVPGTDTVAQIGQMAAELTTEDWVTRPRFLLDVLYRSELVDHSTFKSLQKELFAMVLVSRFARGGRRALRSSSQFSSFLRQSCRIGGVPNDLVDSAALAFKRGRLPTIRVLKSSVQEVSLERHGEFWHLCPTDGLLGSVFAELTSIGTETTMAEKDTKRNRSGIAERLAEARQHKDNGQFLRSLLTYKEILGSLTEADSEGSAQHLAYVLQELGELAAGLNRLREADEFYSRLLVEGVPVDHRLEVLHELALVNIKSGQAERASEFVVLGRSEARAAGDRRFDQFFQRLEAWVAMNRNEYDMAEAILQSASASASKLGYADVQIMLLYTMGVLHWRKGALGAAVRFLEDSLGIASKNNLLSEAVPVMSTMALLHGELAEYGEALKYARLATRWATGLKHSSLVPSIYLSFVYALTRLVDFRKAGYWLERFFNSELATQSTRHEQTYCQCRAFLSLNQSHLDEAREWALKAVAFTESESAPKTCGKAFQNLAEADLMAGRTTDCLRLLAKAREFFVRCDDQTSLAELDLISVLVEHYYGVAKKWDELAAACRSLVDRNSRYYAAASLFHLLLCSLPDVRSQALRLAGMLPVLTSTSKVPLFQAVGQLMSMYSAQGPSLEEEVRCWKRVASELSRSQDSFLLALAHRKITDLYVAWGKRHHAGKFLHQALGNAETLENRVFQMQLLEQLHGIHREGDDRSEIISTFLAVSRLLNNLGDYRESLRQLVDFAVQQSGAERGVLLLPSASPQGFRVIAAVNCDEQSLSDILDFSSTIPRLTARDLEPLVIDNAREDRRTSKYKSVVFHNIMSVVTVPLLRAGELLGILYLDHHTIPALFTKDDLAYVLAIANVASTILSAAQDLRSLRLSQAELSRSLSSLGESGEFVTRSSALTQLFERLPQFARSSVPILIQGESGTGKEVLCHEIHRMSLRSDKPLVKLNCAAIASTMIEGELFGVAKSAATGVDEREGKFSAADGGTLFLDEIGDMPLEIQAKVLRVLEYQQFEKVGSNRPIHTDIRFVYASNRNLAHMVKEGKFREDLFYRINTVIIEIPSLRERPEDVALLVEHFTRIFSAPGRPPRFSGHALSTLSAYDWPGNVRELRNFVERCCISHAAAAVDSVDLPQEIRDAARHASAGATRNFQEARTLRDAFVRAQGNQSEVARMLNLPLTTVRRKLKKYSIRAFN
ncbi:MAG TPA: sigma 54-interacting transcriptional regulator [Candidatus Deferrimicrobium sp.]|nr:sigma 54-interacting transcriptional regulator [Candidatus Deferrimicrobium sp.]